MSDDLVLLKRRIAPVTKALLKILLPADPITFGRLIFSLLSVLALFKYATDHTYSAALELVISNYDETISKALAPLQPIASFCAGLLGRLLSLELSLQPHWRHIFVLMGVYFMSRVGAAFRSGLAVTGWFRVIWGVSAAFLTSVMAGAFEVAASSFIINAAIALAAVMGMVVYELVVNVWYASLFREKQARLHARPVRSWWGEFFALSVSDFRRAGIASLLVLIGLALPFMRHIILPGLVMLALVMFFYGCFWLFWARIQARKAAANGEESDYWSNADAIVGASMVSIFLWAVSVIVIDTGAKIIFG